MGRPFRQYLGGPRVYCCSSCGAHAADVDEVVSKAFQGRHGRAYLVNTVVNVAMGPKEDRLLITGLHTVADIYCTICDNALGWVYISAAEASQQYKVGKFILEKARVVREGD